MSPTHLWAVERRYGDKWCLVVACSTRKDARWLRLFMGKYCRIRKYVPA